MAFFVLTFFSAVVLILGCFFSPGDWPTFYWKKKVSYKALRPPGKARFFLPMSPKAKKKTSRGKPDDGR